MLKKISGIKGVQQLNKKEQLSVTGGELCWGNVSQAHCNFCNGSLFGGYCVVDPEGEACLAGIGYTNC
jgi:hypothetical protein